MNLKDAKTVSIADLKGKVVVVFFYPKALTKGCTIESCGFRDTLKSEDFPKNVVILGASADDVPLQQKFIEKEKLTYPLLADKDMKLIKELGIVSPKNDKISQRVTFVIDKEGKIVKIYDTVNAREAPEGSSRLREGTEVTAGFRVRDSGFRKHADAFCSLSFPNPEL